MVGLDYVQLQEALIFSPVVGLNIKVRSRVGTFQGVDVSGKEQRI